MNISKIMVMNTTSQNKTNNFSNTRKSPGFLYPQEMLSFSGSKFNFATNFMENIVNGIKNIPVIIKKIKRTIMDVHIRSVGTKTSKVKVEEYWLKHPEIQDFSKINRSQHREALNGKGVEAYTNYNELSIIEYENGGKPFRIFDYSHFGDKPLMSVNSYIKESKYSVIINSFNSKGRMVEESGMKNGQLCYKIIYNEDGTKTFIADPQELIKEATNDKIINEIIRHITEGSQPVFKSDVFLKDGEAFHVTEYDKNGHVKAFELLGRKKQQKTLLTISN